MAFTDSFVQDIIACNEAYNAGSALFIFDFEGECSDEPPVYVFTTDTTALVGTEVVVTGTITDRLVDGVSTTAVPARLRKDQLLVFSGGSTAVVTADVLVDDTTSTSVSIKDLSGAVAIGETVNFYSGYELCTVTDLPLSSDSNTVNRTVLKNGIQGSDVKTRINLSSAVQIISSPTDKGQQAVILKAAQGTQDVYAIAYKSSGYMAFGRAKVMNWSATGTIEELERISFTLQWQTPYALAFATTDTDITTMPQLTQINDLLELSGIEQVV